MPTATEVQFTNVNAGSSVLTITYDLATEYNEITVNDGSSTYPAYRAGTIAFIDIGGRSQVKPTTIDFSGDASNIATNLVWSNWGSPTATATGTVDIEGCVPDCATGSQTPTPTEITVSDLSGGVYQSLTESTQGYPPDHYDAARLAQLGG